jgi:elongation factor Ts
MSVNVSAAMVKELREKTSAGMVDCKKALVENNGDMEKAVDWLRTKGLASAQKKAGRTAAEGVVAVATNANAVVLVEINAETDFVARNEMFQVFASKVANIALSAEVAFKEENAETLNNTSYEGTDTIKVAAEKLTGTIGENITFRRVSKINLNAGNEAYSYIHNAVVAGMGKIGVILVLDTKPSDASLGKQLAMHIAANRPSSLNRESLDLALIERERAVQREIVNEQGKGKPTEILEKMLEGKLSKFYADVVLEEQAFVIDPSKKVSEVLKANNVKIVAFDFFVLGDGIKKEVLDFAEEVKKVIG